MKIVSGSSNKPLAKKIAEELGTQLTEVEITVFPDKERRVRILENVLEQDCIAVQSANTPADQNYMELFFLVDGLKRSGARQVAAVIPYLGYQRQDHVFRDGEAVSLKVVVETLEAVGVDKIITIDLHSVKIPEFFKIPITHLSALSVFAEKIKEGLSSRTDHKSSIINHKSFVLVSPDMGGIARIKKLSEMLGDVPFATIEKDRDLATGDVSSKKMEGEVKGKTAIIVDDMIATGKTIAEAAKLLKDKGAEDVFVFATHAVFTNKVMDILQNSLVERVFVTDSVFIPDEKWFPKLEVLTVSGLLAKALKE
jgi:ribose-phosphate pyrophosphokinase